MGIHGNQTHDLLSDWFFQVTLDHHYESFQGNNLVCMALLDRSFISWEVVEGLFNILDVRTEIDKKRNLSWILNKPFFLVQSSKLVQRLL